MINEQQYFGVKSHSAQQTAAADDLIVRRNALRAEWMLATGRACPVDPDTGTEISGSRGGAGDGGFRLTTATTGRGGSSHKILPAEAPDGAGMDDYDPENEFDTWLDSFEVGDGANTKLAEHGLHREHPLDTPGWTHLQTRKPSSGRQTFNP